MNCYGSSVVVKNCQVRKKCSNFASDLFHLPLTSDFPSFYIDLDKFDRNDLIFLD